MQSFRTLGRPQYNVVTLRYLALEKNLIILIIFFSVLLPVMQGSVVFLNVQLSQGSPAVWRMKASQAVCEQSVSRSGGEERGMYYKTVLHLLLLCRFGRDHEQLCQEEGDQEEC